MIRTVSLLMIGSEILDGRTVDTNSQFLINELKAASIIVEHVVSCGDSRPAINRALAFALSASSAVVISGGLGPTSDDITREAVAEFADLKLVLHGDVLGRLEAYFRARQRPFDPSNCKQALFPEGATTVDNPVGSALGFALRFDHRTQQKLIVALPGIPLELQAITRDSVIPILSRELGAHSPLERRLLKVFGLGEAVVGSCVKQLELGSAIEVAYRVQFPQVEVLFTSSDKAAVESACEKAKQAIGAEYVFSEEPDGSMELALHNLLTKNKLTVATAESCTGGLVGKLLTETTGASRYFEGGVITYSNELKTKLLAVKKKELRGSGAVSETVAEAMATRIKKLSGTSIGLSVTGIAGPNGGSIKKPVGTFFIAIAEQKIVTSYRFFFNGSRQAVRTYAAWMALDVVRRHILKLPVHPFVDPNQPVETKKKRRFSI